MIIDDPTTTTPATNDDGGAAATAATAHRPNSTTSSTMTASTTTTSPQEQLQTATTTSTQVGLGGRYPMSIRSPQQQQQQHQPSLYPIFTPGGISYHSCSNPNGSNTITMITVAQLSNDLHKKQRIIDQAKEADDLLREYSLLYAYNDAVAVVQQQQQQQQQINANVVDIDQIAKDTPHFLPSLSILCEWIFGRYTGCTPDHVKSWADALVMSQWKDGDVATTTTSNITQQQQEQSKEFVPTTEDEILHKKPTTTATAGVASMNTATLTSSSSSTSSISLATKLKKLYESYEEQTEGTNRPRRPCGYAFKRGDIAWNCRTCQTDATCVICDDCFRHSNHDGHEVYFHRTTPGGCCDCGDIEAWTYTGCCDKHRPIVLNNNNNNGNDNHNVASTINSSSSNDVTMSAASVSSTHDTTGNSQQLPTTAKAPPPLFGLDDPMEAIKTAKTALEWANDTLTTDPAAQLPPRLRAALGVVIGAGVQCILDAVDGAGIGSDAVQWTKRWSDEAAHVANQAIYNDDYFNWPSSTTSTSTTNNNNIEPATVQTYAIQNKCFPENLRLQLRLHNDDVHTYDEVIEALHDPTPNNRRATTRPTAAVVDVDDEGNPTTANTPPELVSLVSLRENATEMTHHVDTDGQVTVKTYNNIAAALRGYRRLKSRGLQCAVVTTAQVDLEHRARAMCAWLAELAASHPAAQALLVHALVHVPISHHHGSSSSSSNLHGELAGIYTWHPCRMIPSWTGILNNVCDSNNSTSRRHHEDMIQMAYRQRFDAFPPHLPSSYLTHEESELLHGMAMVVIRNNPTLALNVEDGIQQQFVQFTGTCTDFYSKVPYRLPSSRYHKSPHALWGTLPSYFLDPWPMQSKHPFLERLASGQNQQQLNRNPLGSSLNRLTEMLYVVDTDLRKQQEGERMTTSVYPHKLPGLNMISGIGTTRVAELSARRPPLPSPMDLRHLLATSSFRAPLSPILLLLLLDPYPTKQLRSAIHALFLSLLTNSRFKIRFAGALAVVYRPLTTLFCAGIGTDADSPLHFTVQIFTAGSLVRALCYGSATERLLISDQEEATVQGANHQASIGTFVPPIAHIIVRCIHTNLLGSTKEVNMILNNAVSGSDDNSQDDNFQQGNVALLPSLTYVAGEHSLMTPLPAAPDDGFLDSRSTRHKRLPHLLRDLDYVIETPGTALRLLLPNRFPVYQGPALSFRGDNEDVLTFSAVFARMLRLAQGMDPQKRKTSGGHVEYEHSRWFEAFGLSLNFGGTRDSLAESPCSTTAMTVGTNDAVTQLSMVREAMGNIIASLLREVKLWLYREGLLETGLPIPSNGANFDLAQIEALQRSTLHATSTQYDIDGNNLSDGVQWSSSSIALSCATGVKMTEIQLTLIENALKVEAGQRQEQRSRTYGMNHLKGIPSNPPVLIDWLRVPHYPLTGDSLSFHLPLHRALAKCIRSICSVAISEEIMQTKQHDWWKIPVLDDSLPSDTSNQFLSHPLIELIRSTLRTSNCKVVWSGGPDCTAQEAQRRRSRSRSLSANIAVAKVLHSLADHPIRCLVAAQQIERHLWTKNGSSVAGMAINYSCAPLCRSFRDLDLLLVQLSATGMSCGLGARRIFSLLLTRFSLDGYLCDPERRSANTEVITWVPPPRLQDTDHAVILAESFFSTLCVIVTELPLRPPVSASDDGILQQSIRRELLHALAAEARTHSEAMAAASCGLSKREESEGATGKGGSGGLFRSAFALVLKEIGKQKAQSARTSGPPIFELKAEYCNEYDPTFFHLRRQEHQHAMDVVARLRKQRWGTDSDGYDAHCLPIVSAPPKAHPRFLPCRLLLHLDMLDAALRRALLFAMTNGSWIPPPEPTVDDDAKSLGDDLNAASASVVSTPGSRDTPVRIINRRTYTAQTSISSFTKRNATSKPFSGEIVSSSSVSFLEVLQLLTLQVHTLEECAALHMECPDLDDEGRSLSSSLSINSFLKRLVFVPDSLVNVWALQPFPYGPLKSRGSGENRGSILGFLIVLFEHRTDHDATSDDEGGDYSGKSDDHGGARTLASSGLKWLLRVVHSLVRGASSLSSAIKSATTGIPISSSSSKAISDTGLNAWTINEEIRATIGRMLDNLLDLWPKPRSESISPEKANAKMKEARKAAQQRVMDMMKRKQAAFAETISKPGVSTIANVDANEQESDLCIICRCDDIDGENNGPLGYLGHVQRSRMLNMRCISERFEMDEGKLTYRVVGHMGCQLRETESMNSKALHCLPKGSIVTVLKSKVSPSYGILSRRVFVQHKSKDAVTNETKVVEGWASIQSSQGYIILSPLFSLSYNNTKWGSTRPVIKQCGHAAHARCVETHMLSLHQRAAADQPYDGRFAANINDGEFLCPLCKQLSNVLIPRDCRVPSTANSSLESATPVSQAQIQTIGKSDGSHLRRILLGLRTRNLPVNPLQRSAFEDFGTQLYTAMCVPWEKTQKVRHGRWQSAIQKWDVEDQIEFIDRPPCVKSVMRLLRQQHISWAAFAYSASASEAASRGVEVVLPFGTLSETADPWTGFDDKSKNNHPMLLELKRNLTGSSGYLEILLLTMSEFGEGMNPIGIPQLGKCLLDILEGTSLIPTDTQISSDELGLGCLSALVSAIPCHVARDGTIPIASDAKAAASAMWTLSKHSADRTNRAEPPIPLVVRQVLALKQSVQISPTISGTIVPFLSPELSHQTEVYLPGVACGFLYTPLLGWDLCTLSGALMSCILANRDGEVSSSDQILSLAHILLVGRIVQAIITPDGFDTPDEMDLDDEVCWEDKEISLEGSSLENLVRHCSNVVNSRYTVASNECNGNPTDLSQSTILAGIGRAILPFARSLVLMVRACTAALRERRERNRSEIFRSESDKLLDSVVCDGEIMTKDDGFFIYKAFKSPLPSSLLSGDWFDLINRWLKSVVKLEKYHGLLVDSNHALSNHKLSVDEKAIGTENHTDESRALTPMKCDESSDDNMALEVGDTEGNDPDDVDTDESFRLPDPQSPVVDMDDFDDELAESIDEEEEMISFENIPGIGGLAARVNLVTSPSNNLDGGDFSDSSSDAMDGDYNPIDVKYANVSNSPIIPYQPSLLGMNGVGPGLNKAMLDFATSSYIIADKSHLGCIHRKELPVFSLIRLPKSFVELYNLVNQIKGRENDSAALLGDESDDASTSETAICLLTGTVMRAGSVRRTYSRATRQPGACTLHARKTASGIGIFFMVQKCTVLLMHNNKSAYSPSLYVDEHGEEDPQLKRGLPLYLNDARYRALELLWRQHGIPREVAQIRSTSDRVIRDNYY